MTRITKKQASALDAEHAKHGTAPNSVWIELDRYEGDPERNKLQAELGNEVEVPEELK